MLSDAHFITDIAIQNIMTKGSTRLVHDEILKENITRIGINSCSDKRATKNLCVRTAPLLSLSSARLSPK